MSSIAELPIGGTLKVPVELMDPNAPPAAHSLRRVLGDDLVAEGILDGDILVLVDRPRLAEGELLVVQLEELMFLRRWYREEGGFVRLEARDPAVQPLVVKEDQCRTLAVATGLLRSFPRQEVQG